MGTEDEEVWVKDEEIMIRNMIHDDAADNCDKGGDNWCGDDNNNGSGDLEDDGDDGAGDDTGDDYNIYYPLTCKQRPAMATIVSGIQNPSNWRWLRATYNLLA